MDAAHTIRTHLGWVVSAYDLFFLSGRRRHTRWPRDWSSDVCSSDLAREFATHGAKVAVHGRDAAAIETVRAEIAALGAPATISVAADLTSFAEIEAMRARIERELGPIDIAVANAGGSFTPPGPIEETSEAGWRASVDGNLTATFLTIKSVLPGMKQRRRGSIVTVS